MIRLTEWSLAHCAAKTYVALALLAVTLPLSVPAFAQNASIDTRVTALSTELAPHMSKRVDLAKAAQALRQQKGNIEFGVAAYNKSVAQYKQKKDAYEMDLAAFRQSKAVLGQAISAHNANRCTAPANNPGACAGYNAEAAQLNQRKAYLISQLAQLRQTYNYLMDINAKNNELRQILSAKTLAWAAAAKKWNADNDENEAAIARIQRLIAGQRRRFDSCEAELKRNGSLERLHEVCGQPFDGNGNLQALVNQGTGGVTPNSN
ncbi:MAG TPA: hypothetical protein VMV40_06370 [Acidiferrobacter sp.]|nr:hypothetical protein [Acidiferrobacter sp.]